MAEEKIPYRPEDDVDRLAQYFSQKYGSVDQAKEHFDRDAGFDLPAFEVALKRWGVSGVDVPELFAHIDIDWNGTISMDELFDILALPVAEIKRREEHRLQHEIHLIYEELAKCIRERFGSLDAAVAKYGVAQADRRSLIPPQSDRKASIPASAQEKEKNAASVMSLSRASFRKLVDDLGIDLGPKQLQRVFKVIDEDETGFISLQELQKALSYHLVRDVLVGLANTLVERSGSITQAFQDEANIPTTPTKDGTISDSLAILATAGSPAAQPSSAQRGDMLAQAQPTMSEDMFLRLLRKLKVLDGLTLTEATARLIHTSFNREITVNEFIEKLEKERELSLESSQRKKENDDRREREKNKRLREAAHFDSYGRAKQQVSAWAEKGTSVAARPEDLTQDWAKAAREGHSRTQLSDYIKALQALRADHEAEANVLRSELEAMEAACASTPMPGAWDGSSPFTPFGATPASVRASPMTARMDFMVKQASRAVKTQRLVQAAAVGDQMGVQRCLDQRVDIDSMAAGGATALMAAARHGQQLVLQSLLAERADIHRTDLHGRTAVDHARNRATCRDILRLHGGLSGKELSEQADALAQQLMEFEAERAKLRAKRDAMPSAHVLQRAASRNRFRQADQAAPSPSTPGAFLRPPSARRALSASMMPPDFLHGSATFGGAGYGVPPGAKPKPKKAVTLLLPLTHSHRVREQDR